MTAATGNDDRNPGHGDCRLWLHLLCQLLARSMASGFRSGCLPRGGLRLILDGADNGSSSVQRYVNSEVSKNMRGSFLIHEESRTINRESELQQSLFTSSSSVLFFWRSINLAID